MMMGTMSLRLWWLHDQQDDAVLHALAPEPHTESDHWAPVDATMRSEGAIARQHLAGTRS